MSGRWDVAVLGAGANGLAAAAGLAGRGREVVVLERRDEVGGLAAGEQFHPGYRTVGVLHDSSAVRRWAVAELGLERHGLEWAGERSILAPQRDGEGPGLLLAPSAAASGSELERHAAGDGAAYDAFRAFLDRVGGWLRSAVDRVPPALGHPGPADLFALGRAALGLRRLGASDMLELLRVAPTAVRDWLGESFRGELVQAVLAVPAVEHGFVAPRSPGTSANLLLAEALAGAPVRGGPAALVASLARACRAAGVEIRTGCAVERVLFDGERARGVALAGGEEIASDAVAAALDVKHLFFDLLPPGLLPSRLEENLANFRTRGTAAKIDLALDRYPVFACRPELAAEWVRVAASPDEIERAFDPVKYRRLPARPLLDLHLPTVGCPELAPAGHHVASILAHWVPHDLEGGWTDARREELYESVVATLAAYVPGLAAAIVGYRVLAPPDLEAAYGASGGHLLHGEPALDQLLVRPTPECARYATPFRGLYLCGGASHPGGGVTLAPGALAARVIARAPS